MAVPSALLFTALRGAAITATVASAVEGEKGRWAYGKENGCPAAVQGEIKGLRANLPVLFAKPINLGGRGTEALNFATQRSVCNGGRSLGDAHPCWVLVDRNPKNQRRGANFLLRVGAWVVI